MKTDLQRDSFASPGPRPLNLHIDRLVLHDFAFAPRERAVVEQAFQAEATQLVAGGQVKLEALSAATLQRLQLGQLRLGDGDGAQQLGEALAAALLRGIAP